MFIQSQQYEILRKSQQQPVYDIKFCYREECLHAGREKIVLTLTFRSFYIVKHFYSESTASVGM